MRKTTKSPGEKVVKDIKRARRKHYLSEEKIRIVLDGLRGEDSIAMYDSHWNRQADIFEATNRVPELKLNLL